MNQLRKPIICLISQEKMLLTVNFSLALAVYFNVFTCLMNLTESSYFEIKHISICVDYLNLA